MTPMRLMQCKLASDLPVVNKAGQMLKICGFICQTQRLAVMIRQMLNPILIIITINLIIFIAAQTSPAIVNTLSLPSDFSRPWAIVTSVFVHYEFFHLLANMVTLYFFGSYLNRLIGSNKFYLVYFGGGILGSLFFILLAPPSEAIGASGAVFALGGALTVMMPRLRVFIFPIPAPLPLWVAVIGGFLILSFIPGIAWQAHLGGLVFGLGAGYLFKRGRYYYY